MVGVSAERPQGKYVPVRRVGDAARPIEHARDAFLSPIPARLLPRHGKSSQVKSSQLPRATASVPHLLGDEEGRRLRDGRPVLAAGRQQRQQRPRGLHHSAAVVAQLLHIAIAIAISHRPMEYATTN